jgi:hypothetical protein
MRLAHLHRLLGLATLLVCSGIQTLGVTTNPVGASSITIPSGNVPVSCSFVHPDDFIGGVSSVADGSGTSVVSFSGSPFAGSEFNESTLFPLYYLEITEPGHPSEGIAFDIISNDTGTITVAAELSADFSLSGGDQICIRKHMTLNDFFSDAESSLSPFFLDVVKFFNSDGTTSLYTWTGAIWSQDFGTTDHGDRQIYPGEGLLTTFSSDITFVVYGSVKSTKTTLPVFSSNQILVLVGSTSPVDSTLGDLDFAGNLTDFTGTVKFYTTDGTFNTETLYTDWGSFMTNDFGSTDASNVVLVPNRAVLVNNGVDGFITLPEAYSN